MGIPPEGALGRLITAVLATCLWLLPLAARAEEEAPRGLDPSSPYRLSYAVDLPLAIGGAGLTVGGIVWQQRLDPLDAAAIATLDPADVNAFDRVSTRLWNVPAQRVSDVGLALAFVLPASLYGSERVRHDGWRFTAMWAEVYLVTQGLTELTKAWASRIRPYMYNDAVSVADKTSGHLESQGRTSFFSGHSSLSAALCFYTAMMVQTYYPHSRWSRLAWALAASFSALTASLRVIGGRHYPTDVIAGYAVGTVVGVSVPLLHRIGTRDRALGVTPEAGAGRFVLRVGGTF